MTRGFRLTKNKQSPTALGGLILFLMKQEDAQLDANWGGSPSLIHHWMEALLRLAAICLLSLARLLGMRPSRLSGECHTDATPQALPLQDRDPITKETQPAATSSQSTEALMLSSELGRSPRPRPSKHEGGLTAARSESSLAKARSAACQGSRFSRQWDALGLPRLIPAKAGTQGGPQGLSRLRAAAAPPHEESRALPRPPRPRISGHTAPT